MIILLMEVSPFGLRKVGKAEDMDIPKEGVGTPCVKKIVATKTKRSNPS